jgi:hypothetical protein
VLIEDELRSQLPPPRGTWRISCGPRRAGERHCLARRGHSVRRFFASTTADSVTVVPDR